jgi:DNA repair protein RadC
MGRARRDSVGLCGHPVDLELSDSRAPGLGNVQSSASHAPGRGRQILVELLKPFGPGAATWAHKLINEFGSLAAVLAATPCAQARILGEGNPAIRHLDMVRGVMLHVLRMQMQDEPVISNSETLIDYLFAEMAHLPAERLRVLFLNSKNRLLGDEVMVEGSVNEVPIYPREIMRRALEIGATALILAHNHPSGDPKPSSDDIRVTRLVASAAAALDIRLHDHVIVARSGWISFSASGLL